MSLSLTSVCAVSYELGSFAHLLDIVHALQAVSTMFGYAKGELEGKNISCLMPQPFSGRHNGYLQRYTSTGVPHILDTKRHVVALNKVRGGSCQARG
jgi:PAS domain S-box-containing protein